ncbi:hypothetical protein PQX77_002954 [Marasmius sp. AFHP31]|nr:hypothetical protein PQX77_002954 [Marasmius sp. AFHP31]
MPPRGGRTTTTTRRVSPDRVCLCEECATFGIIDSPEGPVKGRQFTEVADYKAHKAALNRALRLQALLPSFPAEMVLPEPISAAIPFPIPVVDTAPSVPPSSASTPSPEIVTPSNISDGNALYDRQKIDRLHDCLKELGDSEAQFWRFTNIEFATNPYLAPSPEQLSIELSDDSLDTSKVRGFQKWVSDSIIYANGASKRHHSHPDDLEKEWLRQWDICWKLQLECIPAKRLSFLHHDPQRQVYLALWLLAGVLHLVVGVSMDHMVWVLRGLALVSSLFGRAVSEVKQNLPTDTRTMTNNLGLSTDPHELVCCPKCKRLYGLDSYPEFCTNQPFAGGEVCNRRLRKADAPRTRSQGQPVRTFHYNNLKEWISWMYNRKDIENVFDGSLRRVQTLSRD